MWVHARSRHTLAAQLATTLTSNRGAVAAAAPLAAPRPTASRGLHTTPPAAFLGRRFFKGAFKGKKAAAGQDGPDVPPPGGKLTLFNQEAIPDDLRLPRPAPPAARIGAGAVDATVSLAAAGAVAGALYAPGLVDQLVATQIFQSLGIVTWMLRDGMGDGGTRSIGKKLYGLEVAYWDGSLASRTHALLRNWYALAFPAAALHPLAEMLATTLLFFDLASVVITQDARKVGDYLFGTRVVQARPDRPARLADAEAVDAIRGLREAVESTSPGLLRELREAARAEARANRHKTVGVGILGDTALGDSSGSGPVATSGGSSSSSSSSGGAKPLKGAAALGADAAAARGGASDVVAGYIGLRGLLGGGGDGAEEGSSSSGGAAEVAPPSPEALLAAAVAPPAAAASSKPLPAGAAFTPDGKVVFTQKPVLKKN